MSDMIHVEISFYISSFLWGMVLVAIYDIFRILRRIVRHKLFAVALEDLCFWVVSAVLVFRMIYQYNNGTIRLPGMLFLAAGMLSYHYLISNPFVGFLNRFVILPIKKAVSFVYKRLKKMGKGIKIKIVEKKKILEPGGKKHGKKNQKNAGDT